MGELRLLTYNVRSLRDDADAVAAVIRACSPDVVCLQEVPRFLRWRSKRAALARTAGLVVGTADRAGGLMVMTSLAARVVATRHTLLPKTPKLHQRAVCTALVELAGTRWSVASIHLSLDADERGRHLPSLWAALPAYEGVPTVVAGDVNELPTGPVWGALAERLPDAWAANGRGAGNTYSSRRPHKRIDGIFVDPSVTVAECYAVDDRPELTAASDHLPVFARLVTP